MSTIHLTRESHKAPEKFRINASDAYGILGPGASFKDNKSLPVITSSSDVTIVGGGFGGIAASLMCKNRFKTESFVVFEKHANWGGTWWANTYPGCASDIPALWYSIFAELTDNWSDLRPPQYEMEEYLLEVVRKHDLNKHAKFETAVKKAVYNDDTGTWNVTATNVKTGQVYEHKTKVLLSCLGGLVQPLQFQAPGLHDRFQGSYMHSALWDHSVDMKGKNVVVVGNGCSAAQVVPALMDQLDVKSVTQVFRSKHYIQRPLPHFIFVLYNFLSRWRWGLVLVRWLFVLIAEMRYPLYQGNLLLSRMIRGLETYLSKRYIRRVAPKKYHDMLIPDYKLGCKRLIFDYKYIPLTNNPKFDLTNSPVKEITEDSVVLEDGRSLKADVIVACTGYDLPKSFQAFKMYDRHGVNVQDRWAKEGATAYKTFMVRDCPNFFMIAGPNSATGHSSVVSAIENALAFAHNVLKKVISGENKSVSVKTSAYYKWFEDTQERLKMGVYGSKFGGCVSWYTKNGVNSTSYPYSQVHYFITSRLVPSKDLVYEDYDVEETKKTV